MNKTIFRSVCMLAVLFSMKAFAWGLTGHRVIAEIAERHLTPTAKANLYKIFGKEKMAYYANWPDFIKSDTTGVWKSTQQWHYVDINKQKDFKTFVDSLRAQGAPNLYTQIPILASQIKDPKTAPRDREIALRFLIHLMGDLSQPLHVGHPDDLGGNRIQVSFFSDHTNLHSVWDSKLVDNEKYSYTEFATVLDVLSDKDVQRIQSGTLEEWLYESSRIADKIYRNVPADRKLGYDYIYKFQDTMEQQLLYGGLRLAKVLNDILG